ncbi:MAG: argininosuccinate lyase [Deltaproteobacteria bacterium]|nr:argininosuccinate lyase [Deltaproteobacteria bacterium]
MANRSWGGRFERDLDKKAAQFSASVDVDKRLAPQDIRGSIAHVRMLGERGIIPAEEVRRIIRGLEAIGLEVEQGRFHWDSAKEDVHMNIEAALIDKIGEVGGKLHTGRSRNDQVVTDMRLWTREACHFTGSRVAELLAVLAVRSAGAIDILLPGYTHLQRAQPIRLAHHLLAWCEMLERDRDRLFDAAKRMNLSPLGSGALATTTYEIDRRATAKELGFDGITRNSLDAVADRDFLIESVAALVNCAVHMSRISEELVLWSSQEFGFIKMSDAFTTGSSMMPQKKNPDMAELVRGKSGRVAGHLVALIVLLKGLPLAYNRDLQEDKPATFDAFDTVNACLEILAGSIATAEFNSERMRAALAKGFIEATELADYLAVRGVPFRKAHEIVGRLVRLASKQGKHLSRLTLEELRAEHEGFSTDVYRALDPETAVERRRIAGGPARARVKKEIAALRKRLQRSGIDVDRTAARFGAKVSRPD